MLYRWRWTWVIFSNFPWQITAQKQNIPSTHSTLGVKVVWCNGCTGQWPKLICLCKLFSTALVSFDQRDVAVYWPKHILEIKLIIQGLSSTYCKVNIFTTRCNKFAGIVKRLRINFIVLTSIQYKPSANGYFLEFSFLQIHVHSQNSAR